MNWKEDVYYAFVNLDTRKDRLTHMQSQLQRVDIGADRVRGILPSEVTDTRVKVMRNRTPGAIGCHFAQVSIMRSARTIDRHAFVMEDDIQFCSDFSKRMDYIGNWLDQNEWDVFWFGGTFHSPAYWHPKGPSKMPPNCSANLGYDVKPTTDQRIVRTFGAFSTFCYLVNKNSIDTVLDTFDRHLHQSIGIDWLFIKFQPIWKCFAFVPGCVRQIDNRSDIGDGVTNFSGFAKLNGTIENSRYWYQDRMEDFDPTKFVWR